MASATSCFSLVFYALFVLQCAAGSNARQMVNGNGNQGMVNVDVNVNNLPKAEDESHLKMYAQQDEKDDHIKTELNGFLTLSDLYRGKTMPIYFALKNPATTPHLLAREEVESIPFSSFQLQYLLDFFSFSKDSPQAKAMEYTLKLCEFKAIKGETKFCAYSLESMLDSIHGILGKQIQVLTTNINHCPNSKPTLLQNYTFTEEPKEIPAPMMIACHTMPYPYAVFYCHGQEENRVFKVALSGENGDKVDATVVCHLDTSQWDSDDVAFRILKTHRGGIPVCHFSPADNVVWVASPAVV